MHFLINECSRLAAAGVSSAMGGRFSVCVKSTAAIFSLVVSIISLPIGKLKIACCIGIKNILINLDECLLDWLK